MSFILKLALLWCRKTWDGTWLATGYSPIGINPMCFIYMGETASDAHFMEVREVEA